MVYNAVECNTVLPISNNVQRTCSSVVPAVKPDLVTYSSYEVTSYDRNKLKDVPDRLTLALTLIDRFAPDPLHLGKARILISEFGLYETLVPEMDIQPRAQLVLETAHTFGIRLVFLWQLYDNECRDFKNHPLNIAVSPGDAAYPLDSQCRGLWLIRPDGKPSVVLPLLQRYWNSNLKPY